MLVQTITTRRTVGKEKSGGGQFGRRDSLAKLAASVVQRHKEGAPITRPQFIEVMLRAAIALQGIREPSVSIAFRQFAEKTLSGKIMKPPLSQFPRGLILCGGVVRDVLLSRRKTLREAFERFGASEIAFQRLAQLLKLCDETFTAKHVASIYALSRSPVADFRSKEATAGLHYVEFCEAVVRLSMGWRNQRTGHLPGEKRPFPPQLQVGQSIKEKRLAARVEAFLQKVGERMKPSIMNNSSLT